VAPTPAVAVPLATPVKSAPEAPAEPFAAAEEAAPIVRPRSVRRSGRGWKIAVGLLGAGLVVVALVLLVKEFYSQVADRGEDQVHESKKDNYRFALPGQPWTRDSAIQRAFQADVALRRTEPMSWLVIVVKDYKNRDPRKSELTDEAVRLLRASPSTQAPYFQSVQWEPRSEGRLADQPALRLEFEAVADEVLMSGDAVAFTYRGRAYWVIAWAPRQRKEEAAPEWSELRKGFSLLNERADWTPRGPKQQTLRGKNLEQAPYTLRYTEGIWVHKPAGGYGELADLALVGHEPGDKDKLAGTAATAVVYLLPRQADLKAAVTAARAFLEEKQKDSYPETVITPLPDGAGKLGEGPEDIGDTPGHLARLRIQNTPERERLVVQAIVPQTDYVLVLQCECDWNRRSFWEEEFAAVWRSLRFKAAP
jgi:hypothetical protein